jgi:hypothetical protein
MAGKKNNRRRPPCPDPELYEWVERSSGGYWRKKKAKGSPVNSSLSDNNTATASLGPAIKRIRNRLEEYIHNLDKGNIQAKISGLLSRPYQETGKIVLTALKGFDFQKEHVLDKLLLTQYKVHTYSNYVELVIPVAAWAVKKHNNLVTDFYFEGILLYGDAFTDGALDVEYALSAPYSFTNTVEELCKLQLPLPPDNIPWMLMLKVSCLEGNEMAAHAKHYGMKVVEAVGGSYEQRSR